MTEDCQALVSQQSFRNPPSRQVSSRAEEMPLAWVQGPGWRTMQGRVRFWWESARRGRLAARGVLGGAGQGGEGSPPSTAVFTAESQAPDLEHGRTVCGVTVKTTRAERVYTAPQREGRKPRTCVLLLTEGKPQTAGHGSVSLTKPGFAVFVSETCEYSA